MYLIRDRHPGLLPFGKAAYKTKLQKWSPRYVVMQRLFILKRDGSWREEGGKLPPESGKITVSEAAFEELLALKAYLIRALELKERHKIFPLCFALNRLVRWVKGGANLKEGLWIVRSHVKGFRICPKTGEGKYSTIGTFF